ncbi:MAG: hypothetical protein AB8G15_16475 [Saprospiraceae bacterium]
MEKVVYHNKYYIYFVLLIIFGFFNLSAIKLLVLQDFTVLFTMFFQLAAIILIVLKHEYVQLSIKSWAIFPLAKSVLILLSYFMFFISDASHKVNSFKLIYYGSILLITSVIFYFSDRYISLKKEEELV